MTERRNGSRRRPTTVHGEQLDAVRQTTPLFSALTDHEWQQMKKNVRMLHLKRSETLFNQGDTARRFFFLRQGRLKLYRLSAQGGEKIVELVRPGEVFANAVMFMQQRTYPVNAEALQESSLYAFDGAIFLDMLRRSPESCFRMLADFSQRMRRQLAEIDGLSLRSASVRLASYLHEHVVIQADGRGKIRLEASKKVIASRLSIQPETFSRVLGTLKKKALIQVQGEAIWVDDVAALERYAQDGES